MSRFSGIAGPAIKGAIFAVVTLVATGMLASTILNRGDGAEATYHVKFTDVTSLNPGDDVRMAGVRIGQVTGVHIADARWAEVEFSVDSKRRLSTAVTATVKFRNLIGQRYISLDQGVGNDTGTLAAGATIPLERTHPALDLTAVFNGFKPLFQALSPQDVNKLSFEIVQVLQGDGGTVASLVQHTGSLTKALADKDQVIGQVVSNLNAVLDEVNAHGDKLSTLISTTQQLVSGLAKDAAPIGNAVDGLGALTEATAGLLAQGREPFKNSVDALGKLSQNLVVGTPEFEKFIRNLPLKYEAIGRTVSYGSWFNFFLCSATANIPPAPGGPPVGLPITEPRCRS